jgi:DNA-binding protein HU-beta
MSKKDLIDAVAAATELPKEKATVAVDAVIAHIEASMKKGEEVRIPGFGTFKVAKRAARKARNPQTGVEMMLKASIVPKFSASKNLKDALNSSTVRISAQRRACRPRARLCFSSQEEGWRGPRCTAGGRARGGIQR